MKHTPLGAGTKRALAAALAALCLANCAREAGEKAGERPEIVVAAAANLADAFEELSREFTGRTGIGVRLSFGATADLARQIQQGAPFDVFAAADLRHVDQLVGERLLAPETRAVYARGRLVVWVPPGGPEGVRGVEDLAGAGVRRVALANPELAPYGAAAVEALRALGLFERVAPKIVYAQNVSQARQFAATGNADAALIPLALARGGRAVAVDERLHRPIDQAIAVVSASRARAAAARFVEFVMSEEGQSLLERHGYARAPTRPLSFNHLSVPAEGAERAVLLLKTRNR